MLLNKEEEFIKKNLGLVHSCCRRFVGRSIEYDDMFQAGCLGLLKAARDFDESRGYMFSTYAVPVILGEIKRLFRDGGAIKVSRSLKELSLKVSRESELFEKTRGRAPSVNELAAKFGVDAADITEAINISIPPSSLTYNDDDGIKELDLPIIDQEENIYNRLDIIRAVECLDAADRRIIYYRYFQGLTQSKTAALLNLSQVQVSRRERKLMEIMRKKLEPD